MEVIPRAERAGRTTRNRLFRLELLVFILSAGAGCFALRTLKHDSALAETSSSRTRSLLNLSDAITNENAKISNLNNSVEGLTKSLAQSTFQINGVSGELQAGQSEMYGFEMRLRGVQAILRNPPEVKTRALEPAPVPRNGGRSVSERTVLSGASLSKRRIHLHPVDLSIPLPASFVAHRNAQQEIDYWIVPRVGSSGEAAVRVQPYGVGPFGLLVHGIDDEKDYVLTEQGGWTEIPADH
jgi:hypothetical protein